MGAVPRAGSWGEGWRCGELPGGADCVVGYDHDSSPSQQGKKCEEHDLVGIQEVLEETGSIRTSPSVIHHKGHGNWDGDGLASRGAGEGQGGGQGSLAAGHRVRDANCVCDKAGQPQRLLLLKGQHGWGPGFHLGETSRLVRSTPTSA